MGWVCVVPGSPAVVGPRTSAARGSASGHTTSTSTTTTTTTPTTTTTTTSGSLFSPLALYFLICDPMVVSPTCAHGFVI